MIQFNTEALYIAFVVANRPDGVHQQTAAISYLVRAYELAGSCSCSRQRCTLVTKNPSTRTRGYSPSRQYSSRVRVVLNTRRVIEFRVLASIRVPVVSPSKTQGWQLIMPQITSPGGLSSKQSPGNPFQKLCRAISVALQ